MKQLKIAVYAICKNESMFVDRFMDAVSEADGVYILDTGSEDNTVELFKKRGAIVHKKTYDVFEFDVARNDSLSYIPKSYDVCFSLDIDEVVEKGFTKAIREEWKEDTKQLSYDHILSFDENNVPTSIMRNNKIHSRNDFEWEYPIHEILKYIGKDKHHIVQDYKIKVWHKPDKVKSRYFYLDMLKKYVEEHPENSRNRYLLTRTLLNRSNYFDCIVSAHIYLDANFRDASLDHKSKVMIYMSKSYYHLKMYEESLLWGQKAIELYPLSRDGFTSLLEICYRNKDYDLAIKKGLEALTIEKQDNNLVNDAKSWNGTIYDYLSLAYYRINDYQNAIKYIDMDLDMHPGDKRLLDNKKLFESKLASEDE